MQHVDPLFALVADEVQVTLRFFQQHALELRSPIRRTGGAGIADRLEVLDEHLLEEKTVLASFGSCARQGEVAAARNAPSMTSA
jgi:hypothetical protein